MSELYHESRNLTFRCLICHQKTGDIDLHMRTYHPKKPVFFVSKRLINDQSTLADICPYCESKTANIMAHVRECHPEKYEVFKYGE